MSDAPNTPEALAKRFQMDHIPRTSSEAKAEAAKAVDPSPEQSQLEAQEDPRFKKEWEFDFDYKDTRGKLWVGKFTNKVLSLRDRAMVGVMRAKMAGGLPADSLDPVTAEINLMVSHLAASLVKAPDWAADLLALEDQELVGQLYDRAMEHEQFFRTGRPAQAPSQGGGQGR